MQKIQKILLSKTGKKIYVHDISKDFHTELGYIKKQDLKKTGKVKTHTNNEFYMFSPSFIDAYRKIKRGAQIITLKDIGIIITETGINKKSKVVDAGSGSGALACFLANIAKEVTTYEIRKDFAKIVEHNKELLCLNNLIIKNKDVFKKIDEKDVDLITLDLPDPIRALKSVKKSLKPAGFLVVYLPNMTQIIEFVNEIKKDNGFVYIKTTELMERDWKIDGLIARPNTLMLGHTGFLVIARKV